MIGFDPKVELPADYEPASRPISQVYVDALRELSVEHPAAKLRDWTRFNQLTGGFRTREFTILCGPTGAGKTTLLANLVAQLLLSGIKTFIASVETGDADFVKRVMSVVAGRDMNTGDAVPVSVLKQFNADHGKLFQGLGAYLSSYTDRVSHEKLLADTRWHVEKRGVQVAIYDNLNFFMEVVPDRQQVLEMDRVVHDFIIFAKNVPVHSIMVMHPRKTENGRVNGEFDLKGSSTSVQEAQNLLLFNRPHPDLIRAGLAHECDRELMIAKMRRRGRWVGHRLILKNRGGLGVVYDEGEVTR